MSTDPSLETNAAAAPVENPYRASPIDKPIARPTVLLNWRMIGRLLAVVFICTIGGGLIGLSSGLFLAFFFPGYYETVFASSTREISDPSALGVGLGLSQGLGGGAAVGVALALIGVWWVTRLNRVLTTA